MGLRAALIFYVVLATPLPALAFDVRGIEPGKTTEKQAIQIVTKTAREIKGGAGDGPWQHCRRYTNLPGGSPLKGYKSCSWYPRYKPQYGELSSPTFGPFVLAGVSGHPGWDVDSKGILQSFDWVFSSNYFEALKQAAIAKWGSPTKITKESLQNRMGAVFESEVLMWKNEKGEVLLYQRKEHIDLGFLVMKSTQFLADDDKDTELRKTQKRKDF